MKKLMLVCGLILGAATMSFAQGGGGQGGGGGRGMGMPPADQAKMYQTQLKLSDDQTAKITSILTVQATKRDSLMKAANGDRQAMMTAFGPMREATNAKIKALLTADQAAAFDKLPQGGRGRQGGGGQSGGGGMGGQGGGTPPPPSK